MDELYFNVVEIFDSIDGEGKRTGELATFIRLSGCNLRCSYCDTAYAQSDDDGKDMSISAIINKVKQIGNKNITITGGEPLRMSKVIFLLETLAGLGYEVNVETNGSIDLTTIPRYKGVFYTMDYKCPSSGMESRMELSNLNFLDDDDVLKFVVGDENDLLTAKQILQKYDIKAAVYLSPVFDKIQPSEIVDYIKSNKDVFHNARVQVQLHKIIWEPSRRGV